MLLRKFKKYYSKGRLIRNIKFLLKNDLDDLKYKIKDETIEDLFYEYEEDSKLFPKLSIEDENRTLYLLKNNPKSFSRFGDGEINLIRGFDCVFQKYEKELAEKMLEILTTHRDDIYIGLNRSYFESPVKFSETNRQFYRTYGTELRRFFIKYCNKNNTYLDACAFGGYFRHNDSYDYETHYQTIKELFTGKKVLFVCGKGILDEIEFSVFDNCSSFQTIEAPRANAFSAYSQIIDEIQSTVEKSCLICLALGMTATAMVADLTDLGYVAWDVGHMASDYDAWKRKIEKNSKNISDFFSR